MSNILLIHGWDYENYHNKNVISAWDNRIKFVKKLKKNHKVIYFDLPGFASNKPKTKKAFNLDDYAKYIKNYIEENDLKIDYILGYSFGGAIAIRYKTLFKTNEKLILISPAIDRVTSNDKTFIKTPKMVEPLRNYARNMYVTHKLKVKEMVYGDTFLKNTYQNIVRINMRNELLKVDKKDYHIIFGKQDDMVKTDIKIPKENISIIEKGGHDIANTHTENLVKNIDEYILKTLKPKITINN